MKNDDINKYAFKYFIKVTEFVPDIDDPETLALLCSCFPQQFPSIVLH